MSSSRSRTKRTLAILVVISSAMLWISSTSGRLGRFSSPIFKGEAVSFTGGLKARVNVEQRSAIDDAKSKTRVIDAYGKLPLSFEANEGQFDSRVKFVSRARKQRLLLTSTEAILSLRSRYELAPSERTALSTDLSAQRSEGESNASVLRMKLVGANPSSKVTGVDQLPGRSNYFIGNDATKWRVNVPTYASVKFEQVYVGVDLVYYGKEGQLEYDFIVAPGARAEAVKLSIRGAEGLRIDEVGDLVIQISGLEVRQHKPFAYQEMKGIKNPVSVRYDLAGNDEVGLEVGAYDDSQPLVIDPVLSYSTYIGGLDEDVGNGIAVDSAGNAFITGRTKSSTFPTTPGVFQSTGSHFDEAFVVKLGPTGSSLVYSTYVGGSGFDEGNGIAVDAVGNAFLTGVTTSNDFPTTPGAFQTTFGGPPQHVFVTKLSSTGAMLVYSTYLGGSGFENGLDVAVDGAGNAHVTGGTTSPDFPITPGAFQTTFRGGRDGAFSFGDAFVTKLNATGTGLLYSTYLGGSKGEAGFGIALDNAGLAYVTGGTGSNNFPTSPGAFQTTHGGCIANIPGTNLCEDGFVTKFNLLGTSIVYSSYLGGIVGDSAVGIAVDTGGNAVVTGSTLSPDFPRVNPFQSAYGGFRDAFVSKVNAAGSALIYSTFLGRSADEQGLGIAVDSGGNTYVTGHTTSPDFLTLNPIQPYGGARDAFVLKLSPAGSPMYSSHLGGRDEEGILSGAIAVDASGSAYVTGLTGSTDFPITTGAFQKINAGLRDIFVTKINDTPLFDVCLQDESNGGLLQVNSTTGIYQFTNCRGLTIGGVGAITTKGCLITLQVNGPDRRLLARIDTCMKAGTASVQVFSQGGTFNIVDRNTANNSCVCAGN